MYSHATTESGATLTPCGEQLAAAEKRIDELERRLVSWLHSCEAMEWLDDDSPLVVQTKNLLER